VTVVGVSVDTVARLQKFRDKHNLGFPFASDHDRSIGAAYGTLKGDITSTHERDTVLIGRDMTVRLSYRRVSAKGHARDVLEDARTLKDQGGL
jgi:peroxiredoxin Q/BCP